MKILFVVFGVTALLALRALAMPLHYPSMDDFVDDGEETSTEQEHCIDGPENDQD